MSSRGCRIILWRHGQTAWNLERRFQGTTDVALTETGLAQARRAARLLPNCRLVEPGDPAAFEQALLETLADPGTLGAMPCIGDASISASAGSSRRRVSRVESDSMIVCGVPLVMPSIREAVFVVSPITAYSVRRGEPTLPESTIPELMPIPIRIGSSTPAARRASALQMTVSRPNHGLTITTSSAPMIP